MGMGRCVDQKARLRRARAPASTPSAIPLALFARPSSPSCPAVSATCSWLPCALDKTKDQSANKALDLSLHAWHRCPEVPRVWERQFHVVVEGQFHSHESTGQSSQHRRSCCTSHHQEGNSWRQVISHPVVLATGSSNALQSASPLCWEQGGVQS